MSRCVLPAVVHNVASDVQTHVQGAGPNPMSTVGTLHCFTRQVTPLSICQILNTGTTNRLHHNMPTKSATVSFGGSHKGDMGHTGSYRGNVGHTPLVKPGIVDIAPRHLCNNTNMGCVKGHGGLWRAPTATEP
jgi:hypothetical protein